jgi:hypothetical protein
MLCSFRCVGLVELGRPRIQKGNDARPGSCVAGTKVATAGKTTKNQNRSIGCRRNGCGCFGVGVDCSYCCRFGENAKKEVCNEVKILWLLIRKVNVKSTTQTQENK